MWMLLHGFTGSPRSWDAVVAQASLDQEPLSPALAGHGPDWRSVPAGSFADEVARISAMVAPWNRPRFIAGYSLGARVALAALATDPTLFDAALLIGVHPGLVGEEARHDRRELDAARAHMLRTQGLRAFITAWENQPLFQSQQRLSEETKQEQRDIRLSHDPEGLARSLEALGLGAMPSCVDALSSIQVPMTLMAGAHDEKFRDIAVDLSEGRPGVECLIVDGAGHNLLLEARGAVSMALSRLERRVAEGARG